MPKVQVTTDSTSDLSAELLESLNIKYIPLYIIMDGKDYKDGLEINPPDIFSYVNHSGQITKTAAVSVADYISLFRTYTDQGMEVVHVNISSFFSSCYQNACIAAAEVGNVYVIDSLNLSTGSGHAAVNAALLAQQGLSGAEIKKQIDEIVPRINASFVLDTLKYLHLGGRCSSVAALGANLLSLKPCIEVTDGKMGVGKKYRGSLDKCIVQYIADRLDGNQDTIDPRRIFITHTCKPEMVELAKETIAKYMKFDEVLITQAGCTISNHCGPGTLGILYLNK